MLDENELIFHQSFVFSNPTTQDEESFDDALEVFKRYCLRLQGPLNIVQIALNVGIDAKPFRCNDSSETWIMSNGWGLLLDPFVASNMTLS